jgi:hypothetical protein
MYCFDPVMAALILPEPIDKDGFNPSAKIPFGVTTAHVRAAMQDFIDFEAAVDTQLHAKGMASLENTVVQANFSSLVGEMMGARIPKHCPTVVKNLYHNGHPDVLPAGKYPNNAAQHAGRDGIEIKASRYLHGWQGHNAEDVWLMVFVFRSGRKGPKVKKPQAFKFLLVAGAMLAKADWKFSGRSKTSRRTITASVSKAGAKKLMKNWIYKCAELRQGKD